MNKNTIMKSKTRHHNLNQTKTDVNDLYLVSDYSLKMIPLLLNYLNYGRNIAYIEITCFVSK